MKTKIYIRDIEVGAVKKEFPVLDHDGQWGLVTLKRGYHAITFLPTGSEALSFTNKSMAMRIFEEFKAIIPDLPEVKYHGHVDTCPETLLIEDCSRVIGVDNTNELIIPIRAFCEQNGLSMRHTNSGK